MRDRISELPGAPQWPLAAVRLPTSLYIGFPRLPQGGLMTDVHSFNKHALAAVLAGIVALTIAILPQGIWSALITVNLRTTPAAPWAVVVMAGLLTLYWHYLGGKFAPSREREKAKAPADPFIDRDGYFRYIDSSDVRFRKLVAERPPRGGPSR
jgi:hypothetical protein